MVENNDEAESRAWLALSCWMHANFQGQTRVRSSHRTFTKHDKSRVAQDHVRPAIRPFSIFFGWAGVEKESTKVRRQTLHTSAASLAR